MAYWTVDPVGRIDKLARREGDELRPESDDDVIVRTRAASLNYKDLALILGWLPLKSDGGDYVPLSDGAGDVVAIGKAVRDFSIGDRVTASFFPHWQAGPPSSETASALGCELGGWLRDHVRLPASALIKVPPGMSAEQAAAFPCAGVTAWHAIVEKARVGERDTVLIMGTGGVSLFALQIAKHQGARVIAITGQASKEDDLRALGADHVIDRKATPDWDAEVLAHTDGRGVDVVVEVGGPRTFQKSLNSLAFGGRISAVGVLSGVEGALNPADFVFKSASVHGIFVGSKSMLIDALAYFHNHGIGPVIDTVFDVADVQAAYRRLQSQEHVGKIVIRFP